MFEGLQNITRVPELKRRILVTGLLLIVYRIGIHIPTPGIDNLALKAVFESQAGTLFGLIDMFSGGALARFSIFTLGIMPYISSSIILQLLTVVIPQLEKLSKEGELGRRKITQYTRYGTIVLSVIQGMGIAVGLESVTTGAGSVVYHPGWAFRVMTVITLTSGTAFLMWLGEQITERGIGNGISLIIFAGIVARFPSGLVRTVTLVRTGEMNLFAGLFLLALMVAVVAVIIYFERAHRRIPVQYARRIVGRKVYGGQSTHLPLKVNTAGVIPPIFASSILLFPATIASFIKHPITRTISDALTPGQRRLRIALRRLHHLLLLLLYGGDVQSGRRRGQHEEVRRVRSRDPSRKEDGGVHRQDLDADHSGRRDLRVRHLRIAQHPDRPVQRPLLFRRNRSTDRGGCRDGHGPADRVAPDHAALRRVPQERPDEGQEGISR